jgi:hypothetical protein
MNQYQLEDLLTNTTLAGVEAFGMYLTLLVAYLVASFTAGKKLSLGQAMTVSILFIVSALVMTWTTFGFINRAIVLAIELTSINPDRIYGVGPFVRNTMALIQVIGIFASLLFMWGVRNARNKNT